MNKRTNYFIFSTIFPLFGFQDPSTPFMEGIVDLHNFIFFYLILILLFVVSLLSFIIYNFYWRVYKPSNSQDLSLRSEMLLGSKILHGTVLEIVWTLFPSLILVIIVLPSFALMFSIDEVENFFITLKAIGHQWYWSYEYVIPFSNSEKNFTTINYDSYMKSEEDLQLGELRLLSVDNAIVLPVKVPVRLLITAADVLHSWTIPSFGVKVDAVPGRLNQAPLFIKREGIFYGQCSELCGVNHAFMPIQVKATTLYKFINWAGIKTEPIIEEKIIAPEVKKSIYLSRDPELRAKMDKEAPAARIFAGHKDPYDNRSPELKKALEISRELANKK